MTTKTIWLDGKLVDWDDATVHIASFGLHYGIGFFEGIRCHATPVGPAIFRLADHVRRLRHSAAIYGVPLPASDEEVVEACKMVVASNGYSDCYLRPLVYMGYAENLLAAPFHLAVMAFDHGPLGGSAAAQGRTAVVSSFRRMSSTAIPPMAKATGQYLNSFLAQTEARRYGCDEAILLNDAGFVTDGWAHNVFAVTNGVLLTPPTAAGALAGITRDTVMTLAADQGISVREQNLVRSELYTADECFLTGTAAGVTPVVSVDGRALGGGQPGPVTAQLARALDSAVHGAAGGHPEWLDHVP